MKNDDGKPDTQSSAPPTRPPKPPAVAAGIEDSGGENNTKADYGCHEALWALSKRYKESDVQGAHSTLIEEEKLLRDHIGFPSYKFQLVLTMARRSDIVLHLGDAQTASSIMEDALSIMADIFRNYRGQPMAAEDLLRLVRDMDARLNVKWRQSNQAA